MVSVLTEFLIRGSLLGVIYGLLALPICLLFATTDTVDVAVGAYAVLAAAIAMSWTGPFGIVLGIACAVLASAVSGLVTLQVGRSALGAISGVLITLGIGGFIGSLVLTVFGSDPMILQPFTSFWSVGGIRFSPQAAINIGVSAVVLLLLAVLMFRTPYGRAMRASAVNPLGAELAGIPVRRIWFVAYLLGGLLAGVAGVLVLYTTGISFSSGLHLTVWSFAAAVLFGMRGPFRAFLGGLVLGIVEAFSAGYLPGDWPTALPLIFVFVTLSTGPLNSRLSQAIRA